MDLTQEKGLQMSAFLSHNTKDKEVAREIAMFLVADDVNVWFDEWQVSAGDSIVDKIGDGLKECSHFVILWSANASTSSWVRKELGAAIAKAIESGTPRVIPRASRRPPPPALLADPRYVRSAVAKRRTAERSFKQLLATVLQHPSSELS
jgi:hypothetical protein